MKLTITSEVTEGATPLAMTVGVGDGRIWGMTPAERLRRTFARIGMESAERPASGRDLLAVHAGWVFDEALIRALAGRRGVILVDDDGTAVAVHAPAGLADRATALLGAKAVPSPDYQLLDALELGSAYNSALRKREPPILRRLTSADAVAVEKLLFQGSYKGVTDLVTKFLWPAPARVVTRWCALAGVRPNHVTFASFLLVLLAFYLFWTGQFGWGLVAAWLMTFFDTVDGKLARVTLTSSSIGNVFDHGIDLIHPPFWWWAWLVGVQAGPHPLSDPDMILAVIVGGYILQRGTEGAFMALFKIQMHSWRRFDSFFRLITARRNPNLILLTGASLLGRPDVGLALVAIWTALSLVVHVVQLVQGMAAPRGKVASWLAG